MTISIDDLLTSETEDEAKASLLVKLEDSKFPVTDWEDGGVGRTLVELDAKVNSDFSVRQVAIARSGILSLAEGDWKTLVAYEFYETERYEATRTVGPQRFYCLPTAGPYTIIAGQLWVADPEGYRFNNIDDGTVTYPATLPQGTTLAASMDGLDLPQGTIEVASTSGYASEGTIYLDVGGEVVEVDYTGTTGAAFTGCTGGDGTLESGGTVFGVLELPVRAESPGTAYNALPNTIQTMVTVLPGVTTTNPGDGSWPSTPGTDQETGPQLEQRATSKWASLAYGQNDDWYVYWARTGHAYAAQVTRVRVDSDPTGGGYVTVTLAGASGGFDLAPLGVMRSWLQAKVAQPTKLTVQSATVEELTFPGLEVWVAADNAAAYTAAAQAALVALLAATEIGGTVYLDAQIEALMAPEGAINTNARTVGADKVPSVSTAIVVLGAFSPTIHAV